MYTSCSEDPSSLLYYAAFVLVEGREAWLTWLLVILFRVVVSNETQFSCLSRRLLGNHWNYFSSNSSHEKSREYQRVYRNRSVGAETPARLVVLEVLHKFSLGYITVLWRL